MKCKRFGFSFEMIQVVVKIELYFISYFFLYCRMNQKNTIYNKRKVNSNASEYTENCVSFMQWRWKNETHMSSIFIQNYSSFIHLSTNISLLFSFWILGPSNSVKRNICLTKCLSTRYKPQQLLWFWRCPVRLCDSNHQSIVHPTRSIQEHILPMECIALSQTSRYYCK